ncbi:unnamed protein product [Hapterophycus canaliculatus]
MSRCRAHAVGIFLLATGATGWNFVAPRMSTLSPAHKQPVRRSGLPGIHARRHRRLPYSPHDYGLGYRVRSDARSRLGSSSLGTMKQEPVPGKDHEGENVADLEPRPFPKVGDVVRYEGKWENEVSFGEVRQLKKVEETGEWRAYVLPLESIGDDQYARKKNQKSKAEDAATLRPVRAFYVRNVDGFKVMHNSATREPRYISDAYELEGFELPKIEVDPVKFAAELESYEDLKRRLVVDAALFGAVGAFVTLQIFGANQGLLFALGALASVAYVILLEKTADDVASGKQDVATKLKGDARFAVPVLLVVTLALKNYVADPGGVVLFKLIPKEEFAAAMIGFIAPARLPLLYREFKSSLRGDEVLDMLPGSLGQGRAILRNMGEPTGAPTSVGEETAGPSLTRVIVVSGPKCLGKTSLVNKILEEDKRLAQPAWCTTRPIRASEAEGQEVFFMKQVKFEELERKGAFLHVYKDSKGESYGLRLEDISAIAEEGKVCIVDANMNIVRALTGVGELALIGVWVSLDSIEAIEERIRTTLISTGAADEPDLDADIRGLVRQAVEDIEFGVMSGVFDFTVINNGDVDESMETLRRAVEFATAK